jgi:catechol-2,3-dioxygenase
VPAGFYHFALEAGSPAALAEKRDALRAKGVETTDIVDHGWAQSIYFRDPNGMSLEYCCVVRNLTEDDATMQERFTVPRSALELNDTLNARAPAAQSAGGAREADDRAKATRGRCIAPLGAGRMVTLQPTLATSIK